MDCFTYMTRSQKQRLNQNIYNDRTRDNKRKNRKTDTYGFDDICKELDREQVAKEKLKNGGKDDTAKD